VSDKQKRRYYWLKLKENFFEEDTIEWLEEQPNGKEYCLFYLKLCLKSLKTEGLLVRNVGNLMIPYDPESLAKLTNSKADTVKVAMDLFNKIGLIEIMDSGEIYLNQ
jgi:predicted phage replisome organizer